MHIPDNYLSPATCAVMGAVMIPVWAVAARTVRKEVSRARIPLLGIAAAFSFLIMMFNVPLPGGTSGHAVGGTLLAVLLGPWSACISISIALLIQALMFGDGGILAFGANCFNMAFVMPFLGYFVYTLCTDKVKGERGEYIGLAAGSYIGINMAALCAAVEFGIQPMLFKTASGLPLYCPYPLSISIPAMLVPHLTIGGAAEVFFTIAVFFFIRRVSPDVIFSGSRMKKKPLYGLLIALICLVPLGLLAAGTAWGEWSANEIGAVVTGGKALGFVPEGMRNGFGVRALLPQYGVTGLPEYVGYVISAIAGVAVLLIAFKLLSLVKKDERAKERG
jgi:cobalt/nickel transport system permease protein